MANQEQLALLKRSVEEWNQWRKNRKDIKPDLRRVELNYTDLHQADLSCTNLGYSQLIRANFHGTNLRSTNFMSAELQYANFNYADLTAATFDRANLTRANLSSANLSSASLESSNMESANLDSTNLSSARLSSADLSFADLSFANLNAANLCFADLRHARLNGSDLSSAQFKDTKILNLDLRPVKGLTEINHEGPSEISTSTFIKSAGQIPEAFLQGIGLSKWEIEAVKLYNPNLTQKEITNLVYCIDELRNSNPIQIHNLFISYSHADAAFVDALEVKLKEKDIRFWRDIHDATAGPLEKIVLKAIRHNPVVLLIFSKDSVKSDWVEFEIKRARKLEKEEGRHVICPIALDNAWKTAGWSEVLMDQVMDYNILDFSGWRNTDLMDTQFEKLVKGLDLFYKK